MEHEAILTAAPYAVVVDDNPVILLHAVDILEDAGFSVFCSAGSDGALEWLETHGDKIVLLLTNVDIPGPLMGFALSQVAAMRWPHLAIVASSGKFSLSDGDLPEDAEFVPKPFTRNDIKSAVRIALRKKAPALLETDLLSL